MNIVFHHNNKSSGIVNYARFFVSVLSSFAPTDSFKLYKEGMSLEKVGVFHSLDAFLPSEVCSSKVFKMITIENMEFYSTAPWWKKKFLVYQYKKAVQKTDLILTSSIASKKELIELLSVSEEKVKVVYPLTELDFTSPISEDEKFEIQHQYQLPKRFILNVGRVESKNNQLSIVKAIQDTDVHLVLVGDNTRYARKIKRFIKKNKMNNQVVFIDRINQEDLAKIHQLASYFVYPSESIGDIRGLINSLQSKTPILISNTNGFSEFGGDNALYVNSNSIEDIKSKVSFLWENESDGVRRVEKSIMHSQQFNNEMIASQLMDLYGEYANL